MCNSAHLYLCLKKCFKSIQHRFSVLDQHRPILNLRHLYQKWKTWIGASLLKTNMLFSFHFTSMHFSKALYICSLLMKISALINASASLHVLHLQQVCNLDTDITSCLKDTRPAVQSNAADWVIPKLSIISWNPVRRTCGGGIFNPELVTRNGRDIASVEQAIVNIAHKRRQRSEHFKGCPTNVLPCNNK